MILIFFFLQSFEASKRSSLNSRFEKFEEALKKKEEEEMMKTQQQREKLDKKLEEHIEKREAYLNDIKSKLKDHVSCSNWIEVHSNHFFLYSITS